MLIVGDIHITSKISKDIISSILNIIEKNKDEKNIIFLGDYVYHFNYDRKALLDLFDLFLQLYKDGKNLYILAGNHDWIKNRFVYEEAKKMIDYMEQKLDNKIYFIYEPEIHIIENTKCLFFPFNNSLNTENKKEFLPELNESLDIKENISFNINNKLKEILEENITENEKAIVFHHYYFEGLNFPGQKSKFKFSDIALSKEFLNYHNLFFISGHLHKGFMNNNYLCSGSVWCTSPLEQDTFKYIYTIDINNQKLKLFPMNVNIYLTENYQNNTFIDEKWLINKQKSILKENMNNFNSNLFIKNIDIEEADMYIDLKNITITINSEELTYEELNNIIDKNILEQIKDIKIKKFIKFNTEETKNIVLDNKDFVNSILNWKDLTKEFIEVKYFNEKDKYFKELKDLGIF